MNLALGLPETLGLTTGRSGAVSVTRPGGFRAAGVAAGLKSTGARTSRWSSTTDRRTPRPASSPRNRCQANPVLWSQEVVQDGVVRAVVLNSGGANCYTGPEGFQTTHAVAERVAAAPRYGCRRRRGLLDRPDRRSPTTVDGCSPASTRRTAALSTAGGGRTRPTRS